MIIGYRDSIDLRQNLGAMWAKGGASMGIEFIHLALLFVKGIIQLPAWAQNYISIWITSHHQLSGNQSTESAEQILKALSFEQTAITQG